MLCSYCNYVFDIKRGEELICPICKGHVNIGKKFTLIECNSRDDTPRSDVHNKTLKVGAVCYIDIAHFRTFWKRASFHVECDDEDNYLHNILTSRIELDNYDGKTLLIRTANTEYVFQKAE